MLTAGCRPRVDRTRSRFPYEVELNAPHRMLLPLVPLFLAGVATASDDRYSRPPLLSDVTAACIDVAGHWDEPTSTVARWLSSEVGSRLLQSSISWTHGRCSQAASVVMLAIATPFTGPLKETLNASHCGTLPPAPGSFILSVHGTNKIALTAIDPTGLRSGAGRLLRELRMPGRGARPTTTSAVVSVPQELCVRYDGSTALWPIRGHQISVNYHPLQLRTRSEFDEFARDLSSFGTTTLEAAHLRSGPWQKNGVVDFSSKLQSVALKLVDPTIY